MPIEIREVIIKANVRDAEAQPSDVSPGQPAADLETLIEVCVEQVLQILDDKKAR
jgi:hypothetical protein